VDCLRINPGNIGATWRVQEVTRAAPSASAIRIGVNAGSLRSTSCSGSASPPRGLVESALFHIRSWKAELPRDENLAQVVGSRMMIEAYRQLADKCRTPSTWA